MPAVTDKVWIPDTNGVWKSVEVLEFDPSTDTLTVLDDATEQQRAVKKTLTLSWDRDHELDFTNSFRMGDLNEAALLNLLQRRALRDDIYTFTGDILLSVNPYKAIESLYEPMPSNEDLQGEKWNIDSSADARPHLYVLAARSYDALFSSGIRGTSQAVLINGESGAGKTEAAKRIMAFLMELSQRKRKENAKNKKSKGGAGYGRGGYGAAAGGSSSAPKKKKGLKDRLNDMRRSVKKGADILEPKEDATAGSVEPLDRTQSKIEKIILRTNPLLEAFGNARTIRNDNSSRFGKFVQLEYDQEGVIKGARTRHFLLEKSRISSHGHGERNYHVFYQMCAAFQQDPQDPVFADVQMLKKYDEYRYLSASTLGRSLIELPGQLKPSGNGIRDGAAAMTDRAVQYMARHKDEITANDKNTYYGETAQALEDIKLELAEKKNIWRTLACILLLGNLEFEMVVEDVNGRKMDVTAVVKDIYEKTPSGSKSTLEVCAALLGVKVSQLDNALTKKTIKAGNRNSVSTVALTSEEAAKSRDGLAKAIYEALFEWMLDKVNIATGAAVEQLVNAQSAAMGGPADATSVGRKTKAASNVPVANDVFIGILDIFGFEQLADNNFEQLCINYANEVLQHSFDLHVFELEQEGYKDEEIDFAALHLEFRDNKKLLDLLNKRATGVFQLMDEQGALGNRGSDQGFFNSLKANHENAPVKGKKKKQEIRFAGTREDGDKYFFTINHFAGLVEYTATGMVEKNADHLQADLADLIAQGGMPVDQTELTEEELKQLELDQRMNRVKTVAQKPDPTPRDPNSFVFVQMILKNREMKSMAPDEELDENAADPDPKKVNKSRAKKQTKQNKMAKLQSVSSKFRKQMTALQTLLDDTEQHFVRCIKPNDLKEPPGTSWDAPMVNQQLRMLGALEMVRVRREGLPVRTPFHDLLLKFPNLVKEMGLEYDPSDETVVRHACVEFLSKIDPEGKNKTWYLGLTKAFLREDILREMNDQERAKVEKEEKLKAMRAEQERERKKKLAQVIVAKYWRGYRQRKKFKKTLWLVVKVQAMYRGHKVKSFKERVKLLTKIQAVFRGFQARRRMGGLDKIAKVFNPLARGYLVRRKTYKFWERKKRFATCLEYGEYVVLESVCVAQRGRRRNATLNKIYCLILTIGPSEPRLIYCNKNTGGAVIEFNWDDRWMCALMANEHELILYTRPNAEEMEKRAATAGQKLHKFTFAEPVAANWLLALRELFNIWDILALQTPNYSKVCAENPGVTKEIIQDHGNMMPLNFNHKLPGQNRLWGFGGPGILAGNTEIRERGAANLNQLTRWRRRYFVLKDSTLFWFGVKESSSDDDEPLAYPIGGLHLSTETTVNNAGNKAKFFDAVYKQKSTLEVESRLLKDSLKINVASDRDRQKWVSKMRNVVREKVDENNQKRMSLTRGVLDQKGFAQFVEQSKRNSIDTREMDFDLEELQKDDEDDIEDIEHDLPDDLIG